MKILAIIMTLITTHALKAESIKFSYPELQVTPLASETLKRALAEDKNYRWTQAIAVQVPSALNLAAGALTYAQSDEDVDTENTYKTVGATAMGIGGFWLGATIGVSLVYRPYRSVYFQIKKMKITTKRDQLIKERLAEGALRDAYSLARKIEHLSVWTNFAASAAVLSQAESNSTKTIAIMAAISLSYLIFSLITGRIHTKDRKVIKEKYTAPIARGELLFNKTNKSFSPALKMSYRF